MKEKKHTPKREIPVFIDGYEKISRVLSRKNSQYLRGAFYDEDQKILKFAHLSNLHQGYVELINLVSKDWNWIWINPNFPYPKLHVMRYLPMTLSEAIELNGESIIFFDIEKGKAYECVARFLLFHTERIFYVRFEDEEEETRLTAEEYMKVFVFLDQKNDLMR